MDKFDKGVMYFMVGLLASSVLITQVVVCTNRKTLTRIEGSIDSQQELRDLLVYSASRTADERHQREQLERLKAEKIAQILQDELAVGTDDCEVTIAELCVNYVQCHQASRRFCFLEQARLWCIQNGWEPVVTESGSRMYVCPECAGLKE